MRCLCAHPHTTGQGLTMQSSWGWQSSRPANPRPEIKQKGGPLRMHSPAVPFLLFRPSGCSHPAFLPPFLTVSELRLIVRNSGCDTSSGTEKPARAPRPRAQHSAHARPPRVLRRVPQAQQQGPGCRERMGRDPGRAVRSQRQ